MRHMRTKVLAAVAGAAMVGSLVGGAAVYAATQTFTDVPPSNPFFDEIEWAAANGIADGYPDGTFRPAAGVTRQASVAFLGRYNDAVALHQGDVAPISGTGGNRIIACPPGRRALSGGGRTASAILLLTDSYPIDQWGAATTDPADARGWLLTWRTDDGATLPAPTYAAMWVLCAPLLTSG